MYRNLGCLPSVKPPITQLTSTFTEKHQHGPDTDISRALAEKRKQIDEEIANFKALKEKEFREFEKNLLKQRQRQRQKPSTSPAQNGRIHGDGSDALSLLSGVLNQSWLQVNDLTTGEKENIKPGAVPFIRRKQSPVAKPISNVTPVTVTAAVLDDSPRSPSPTLTLKRQSADTLTCLALPPHQQSRQERELQTKEELREQVLIVSSSHDNHSSNTNLAAFLPLLPSYTEPPIRPLSSISGPVASSAEDSIYRLSPDPLNPKPILLRNNSLPLPSALRTQNGAAIRKHKHVTLQLADSVIVEPSSSYEEGPSPIAEDDLDFSDTECASVRNEHEIRGVEREDERNVGVVEEEYPDSSADGLLETRRVKLRRSSVKESREKRKKKKQQQQHEQEQEQEQKGGQLSHSLRSPLEVSVNGNFGSGIGFFELDEELASPARDARFFDDEEDVGDQPVSGRFHKHGNEDDREEHGNVNTAGTGAIDLDGQFFQNGTKYDTHDYGASVPIDIVRPSGSWIGSFGH